MTRLVQWDRLIRYTAEDGVNDRFGEPILPESGDEDIAALASKGQLQVKICEGSDGPLSMRPTPRIDTVKTLLGPLKPKDVPIIRCIGLNYKTHILETGRPLPTCPTVFTKPSPSVAAPGEDIPIPRIAQSQCDYEGELVIVIGQEAKNVKEEDALNYVA
ncbi:hypothetical protein IFR05_007399, partial [Cadophora sp. M221]